MRSTRVVSMVTRIREGPVARGTGAASGVSGASTESGLSVGVSVALSPPVQEKSSARSVADE